MFQPFIEFKPEYVNRLVGQGVTFLVSQTYHRYVDNFHENKKTGILLTDYTDLGLAQIHLKAIIGDRYASIIHINEPVHKEQLFKMLNNKEKFKAFWGIVRKADSMETRLDARFKGNALRFIAKNTNWHVGRNETIEIGYEVSFGELYAVLKRGRHRIRIKFEEIEKS